MLCVGGIGGSGTRLLAFMLETYGFDMGNDHNKAKDYLVFKLLFKNKTLPLQHEEIFKRVFLFEKILKARKLTDKEKDYIYIIGKGSQEWIDTRIKQIILKKKLKMNLY